jgi:GNAT superfamily N-acetyltransferase
MSAETTAREKVTIRPARPEDAPAITELARQLGYPNPVDAVLRRLAAIGGRPGAVVLVAELASGAVVAWTCIQVSLEITSDPHGEIAGFVVDEKHRNRRIGHVLLGAAEAWARKHGCAHMGVHSNVVRLDAHRFYEQQGYVLVKSQKVFRKEI